LTIRDNQRKSETEKVSRKTSKRIIKFSKTDARYWKQKVAFQTRASRTYSVQLQHKGERHWLGLGTANKEDAATLALKLYHDVRANGWEVVMARRRGDPVEKKVNVTIGEYLEAVAAKSLIYPKTVSSYAKALRKIAGDIARETKREKRDAIRLRTLTPEKIEAWRIEFIRRKATDPLKEKSARISANAFLGRARALFSSQTVSRVRDIVELPEPLPFSGVKVEYVRVPRYRSTFDMAALLESAREELATSKPEQYKIFLLASMAGLRRNEIDKLPWTAFRWNEGVIRIEATRFFRPKSHESEGDVLVDPELLEIFRGYHARGKSEFVIESDYPPNPSALYDCYRCEREIKGLTNWLRSKGVISKTPLHSLRKEYGSQINARYGLTAAQEQLRHANIGVTAAHYVENKHRSVLSFGHLLKGERTIIPMVGEAAS
jgi:Phage integrase family